MRALKYILLLLPFLSFGQSSPFCGNYTSHAPISITGLSNQRISGYQIVAVSGQPLIKLTNCNNVVIENNILNGNCTPSQDVLRIGIELINCTNVTIDTNLVTKVATGVYALNCTGGIDVHNNYFQNMTGPFPRGQAVQFNACSGANNQIINNNIENLAGASAPEDCINVYNSHGTAASPITVSGNQIRCTSATSGITSGGGVLIGDGGGSYQTASNNTVVNPGHYGVGVAGGTNWTLSYNRVYSNDPTIHNPVGLQAYNSTSSTCGTGIIQGNQITCLLTGGGQNPYYIPVPPSTSSCSPLTNVTNNWNAGLTAAILPAVLIPTCTVAPPVLSYSPNTYTFYVNATVPAINITNTGGACSNFTISPAQPNGLLFNTTTGQITGVPLSITPQTVYTITGTNAGGQSTTHLTLTIIDNPPVIAYSPASQVCTINTAITNMLPTNGGGRVINYTITPALPTGLSFNTTSGLISGTPTVLSPVTNYTVTGFNSGGSSHVTVTLSVIPPAPAVPVIAYSPNTYTFPINVAISPVVPNNTGGAPSSYGINTSLPAGLSFNTSTGIISGTPTVNSSTTTYTVSATNVSGTGTAPITITVITVLPPPPSITYNPSTVALQINQPSPLLVPINTGGTAVSWSATLPTGMTINTSTGVISGTPTVLTVPTVYTVTATNTGGSGSFPLTISVVAPSPGPIIRIPNKIGVLVFPP